MRLIAFFLFLLFSFDASANCSSPPCWKVLGASMMTGVPRNGLTGNSIPWSKDKGIVQRLAQLAGHGIGGTPAGGAPYPDECTDGSGPPNSTCPAGWPACDTQNNKPLCDLACAGSFTNIPAGDHCRPICNVSGGTCQAGSQVAYVVAEIAAAGANEIAGVVLNFSSNDLALSCIGFDAGSTATWDAWLDGITASISDITSAISANPNVNAPVFVLSEPRGYHNDGSQDQYWTYLPSTLPDCWGETANSNWGGPYSEFYDYIRTESATYGAIYVEFLAENFVAFGRYEESTYLTTDPTLCTASNNLTACTIGHFNHFAKNDLGEHLFRLYQKEFVAGTDTDGDGLTDYYETNVSGTQTNNADTDGDGCPDGVELSGNPFFGGQSNPLVADFMDLNGDKKVDEKDRTLMTQRAILRIGNETYSTTYQKDPPPTYAIGDDPVGKWPWNVSPAAAPEIYPTIKDFQLLEIQIGRDCNCSEDLSDCRKAVGEECKTDYQCLSGACGCNGNLYRVRRCLTPDTGPTGGYSADPRICTNLAAMQPCLQNSDCSSNVCSDAIVSGYFACVGN